MKNVIERCNVEKAYDYRRWTDELPYLSFPRWVEVKIIPPFGGAIARFLARKRGGKAKGSVSVYFDAYHELGYYGDSEPYWEVYPDAVGEDVARFAMNDVDGLIREVCSSIRRLERLAIRAQTTEGEKEGGNHE